MEQESRKQWDSNFEVGVVGLVQTDPGVVAKGLSKYLCHKQ